jgi:hypothetical protein
MEARCGVKAERVQVGPATIWFARDRASLLAADIPADVRDEVSSCWGVEEDRPFWVEVDRMRPMTKHGPRPSAILYGFDEPTTFGTPTWWKHARRARVRNANRGATTRNGPAVKSRAVEDRGRQSVGVEATEIIPASRPFDRRDTEMGLLLMDAVGRSDLPARLRPVALVFARKAEDRDGSRCFPGAQWIADYLGVKAAIVRRHRRDLIKLDVLGVDADGRVASFHADRLPERRYNRSDVRYYGSDEATTPAATVAEPATTVARTSNIQAEDLSTSRALASIDARREEPPRSGAPLNAIIVADEISLDADPFDDLGVSTPRPLMGTKGRSR